MLWSCGYSAEGAHAIVLMGTPNPSCRMAATAAYDFSHNTAVAVSVTPSSPWRRCCFAQYPHKRTCRLNDLQQRFRGFRTSATGLHTSGCRAPAAMTRVVRPSPAIVGFQVIIICLF